MKKTEHELWDINKRSNIHITNVTNTATTLTQDLSNKG